ncbi:tol-pal system YbgF family protein [Streptomyces yaizuensis]|uniref:Transcriptional regulator n=1 Tax=Streptomyces yaizuensis TaxID=2989713 RepID=A0ABQ5NUP8_9ACTN|nr:transcriptional regulator [Streptomyces sp. YSPA8]GLF94090.1 transcriptional regulator [Streptomyces sp. YSPA8]
MDPSRRRLLGAGFFPAAGTFPAWEDIDGRAAVAQDGTAWRIGEGDVSAVTDMTRRLSDFDYEFGGRITHAMAVAFLTHTVIPDLSAPGTEAVRKAMLSVASELSYLIGYMAVDAGLHGAAQQYYLQAMEWAGAASDPGAYCLALHGVGSQALQLGHGRAALRAAVAARSTAVSVEPNLRAFIAGQHARASALAGDRREALSLLKEAEREMSRAEPSGRAVVGHYREATLELDIAQVAYAFKDIEGSVASLKRYSDLQRGRWKRRRKVLDRGTLAERQFRLGHLEEACATWRQVLADYPHIKSARADQRIVSMGRALRPHLRNRLARQLYERGREVAPGLLAV